MEKQIRTLTVIFNSELQAWEIPLFRGAVVGAMGEKANLLFHNHLANEALRYSYPLIQYKRIGKKACVLCVEEGVDTIGQFFTEANATLKVGEREMQLEVEKVIPAKVLVQLWKTSFVYHINRWLPFNSANYARYMAADSLTEKTQLLENILKGNLLSMLKGLDIRLEEELQLSIKELSPAFKVYCKGVPLMAFNAEFGCNLSIPNYLGIGKHASMGYGVVHQKKKE